MIDGCTVSGCRLKKKFSGGVEVNCEYRRLSHTKPKAQGSVRQPSLERKDEAAKERSDWYCFGSDRQCLLRLCHCALGIILTWHAVIVIPRAFLPSLMVLQ